MSQNAGKDLAIFTLKILALVTSWSEVDSLDLKGIARLQHPPP